MRKRTFLITRPDHEIRVSYCSKWAERVIEEAGKRGISVIDLSEKRANRKEVEDIIQKMEPNLIFFNGHGDEMMICGHNDECLIEAGVNDQLLKSKIVYSIACKAARVLGPRCTQSGAGTFIGYKNDFMFVRDKSKSSNPTSDSSSKPFFEASNIVPISLIKGKTTNESFLKSKESFKKQILYYLRQDQIESPDILPHLVWDSESLVIHGDREARFV